MRTFAVAFVTFLLATNPLRDAARDAQDRASEARTETWEAWMRAGYPPQFLAPLNAIDTRYQIECQDMVAADSWWTMGLMYFDAGIFDQAQQCFNTAHYLWQQSRRDFDAITQDYRAIEDELILL
jgi:hypothetical protein